MYGSYFSGVFWREMNLWHFRQPKAHARVDLVDSIQRRSAIILSPLIFKNIPTVNIWISFGPTFDNDRPMSCPTDVEPPSTDFNAFVGNAGIHGEPPKNVACIDFNALAGNAGIPCCS